MTVFSKIFHLDWASIHSGESSPPLCLMLAPLSLLYGFGAGLRLKIALKKKREKLPGFVVSIGNLTTGGTGKTPAVQWLAEWARGEGFRAAVLSRGYGGRHGSSVLVVSDGKTVFAGPDAAGDEPYLLAKNLRGIPVLTAKKRYQAGLLAHRKYGCDFFILDDGFQHLTLQRDLDLVLMDAVKPFGNGRLLPRGPLREPINHLTRADVFVITRSHEGVADKRLSDLLPTGFPHKPLFRSTHQPRAVVFPHSDQVFGPEFMKGKRVVAFAGIARPDVFKETLTELGADILLFKRFRDHHNFSEQDLFGLAGQKETLGADCLITTEKDWVRAEKILSHHSDAAYLTISFSLSPSPDAFLKMVKNVSRQATGLDR